MTEVHPRTGLVTHAEAQSHAHGVPRDLKNAYGKLEQGSHAVLAEVDVIKRLQSLGGVPMNLGSAETQQLLMAERKTFEPMIKRYQLKTEQQ